MGASLGDGWVEDGCVACPWHAWRFRLSDGAWLDNPKIKTQVFPVRLVGNVSKSKSIGLKNRLKLLSFARPIWMSIP